MEEQRYQMREQEGFRRYIIVDTWNADRVVASSPYSGEALRKLFSLRNRVGNGGVYSRG